MTIDEAITFCNEKSKNIKLRTEPSTFEQIAEWLEELKATKSSDIPIIHGKEELELHDKAIRNKAIDDFAKEYKSCDNRSIQCKKFLNCADCIAEQLKAGGEYAGSI